MKTLHKHETFIYVALWSILFITPVLSMYVGVKSGDVESFRWDEVLHVWQQFAAFLLLFLFHNFVLAPLLVNRQRQGLYFGSVAVMVVLFTLFQCAMRPDDLDFRRNKMEQREHMRQHESMERPADMDRPDDMDSPERHGPPPMQRHAKGRPHHRGPMVLDWHDVFSIIMLILMLGGNLGVKLYFKNRRDQQQLTEMEKQNLEQQLEYLKYQINPHFFMNTLNNIHALVDIDPEKAKDTILELSMMMRFVLYEGNKQGVPLSKEFQFIRNYVTLMSLRYTDKVDIVLDLPTETPDHQLPPLMLITFIENAFKHGISYQHPSFVHVKVTIENAKLHFECSNSKGDSTTSKPGGVGLQNVQKRLNLIYGKSFTLNIKDQADTYDVDLVIPLKMED